MNNMLTVKQLQVKLNMGKNKAYKLVHLKGFPSIQIGKTILVSESELNKWLLENQNSQIYL